MRVERALRFGRYDLIERLGLGGMAEVFRARDAFTGAEVALKRILPNLSFEPEFATMFEDEARLLKRLHHPNICRFHERGEVEGELYFTMELVSGRDLRAVLESHPDGLPLGAACYLLCEVCSALSHVHESCDASGEGLEVIHRNVVPANVMIGGRGEVKLVDFGIARARLRKHQTQPGVLKGLFGYMAPEQIRGQKYDARADLFGLGAVAYEALTGHAAFVGESDFDTLERNRNAEYPALSQLRPELPEQLVDAIERALAREPDDRWQTAHALRGELARLGSRLPDFSQRGCAALLD